MKGFIEVKELRSSRGDYRMELINIRNIRSISPEHDNHPVFISFIGSQCSILVHDTYEEIKNLIKKAQE